jgi:Uma2 family endonuclease
MTFSEFEQIPNPPGGRYELHHGELVTVAPPKFGHLKIQHRWRDLLGQAAAGAGEAYTEAGFRPAAEHECRIADVAFAGKSLWEKVDPNGYFMGVPELVIEILSPSNTAAEMLDKEQICLENGAKEFWVVDPDRRQVKVSTPDARTLAYKSGQEIPLFFGGVLAVDAIFT